MKAEEIEQQSFKIIEGSSRISASFPESEVVKRVIHATADFDFAELIVFNRNPIESGIKAIRQGRDIVTDVNMVKAGINAKALAKFGGKVKCFIDEKNVFSYVQEENITRAGAAFRLFKNELNRSIVVIGNAPTALFELYNLIDKGIKPAVVIGVPVGFVGAKEAKEKILNYDVPSIVVKGVKGGSSVAVAIVNALLRLAAED